jgi:hypothetical protein
MTQGNTDGAVIRQAIVVSFTSELAAVGMSYGRYLSCQRWFGRSGKYLGNPFLKKWRNRAICEDLCKSLWKKKTLMSRCMVNNVREGACAAVHFCECQVAVPHVALRCVHGVEQARISLGLRCVYPLTGPRAGAS